jgi:Cu(I)/Ag(I) efflux system membrane fusion protein
MSKNRWFLIASLLLAGGLLASCGKPVPEGGRGPEGSKVLYWVDAMHPAYKSDKPGKAPDCGMDLVPVYAKPRPAATPSTTAGGGRKVL